MTRLLIRWFVKNPADTRCPRVRQAYGTLAAVTGILCNLLLCAGKFAVGLLSGSIAVQADAVNNLSDMGASAVTLVGFKAAGKPADPEHPYGHARLEYISALIVALLIFVAGFELARESVKKIFLPSPVDYSPLTLGVLLCSILIKLWMGLFTRDIGRRIQSATLSAATLDSLTDMAATGAVLLCALASRFFQINLDGYVGLAVSLFVFYAGVGIIRPTISLLMGEAPDPRLVQELSRRLLAYEGINGLHDIMVHSYGPGRTIATVHAEVDARVDITRIHAAIDRAERELGRDLGLTLTIHPDPVAAHDPHIQELHRELDRILLEVDPRLSFHDMHLIPGDARACLSFDLVVPFGLRQEEADRMAASVRLEMTRLEPGYECRITLDTDYSGLS